LAGGSSLKKQLAIVVLRRSIPPDTYQDVLTLIVKSESDPEVRKTALEQAATLRDVAPAVAQAITQAAIDASRSSDERQLATNTVRQLGLRSTVPVDTYVLFSSGDKELSYEDSKLGSSFFAHYLLRGLSGEAGSGMEKNIRVSELSEFVTKGVQNATKLRQTPGLSAPRDGYDPVIVGPGAKYSRTIAVAVGNSNYTSDIGLLMSPATNARAFSEFWQSHGAETTVLMNVTRNSMLQALQLANAKADSSSLQLLYYSGHAFTDSKGMFWILPIDAKVNQPTENSVSAQDISDFWSKSPARTKILFLDTAFASLRSSIR
jgi:Caspase domain